MPCSASTTCAFCGSVTDLPPLAPRRTRLSYRESETGVAQSVQLPRTVTLCERCTRQQSLLAGCPRCRRYGRFPPYAHAPYGSFCEDCGGRLYLLSGEDPVR